MNRTDKILLPYRARFDGFLPLMAISDNERLYAYDDILERILCTEYEYKNLPFESHFFERALNTGVCAVCEIPKSLDDVNGGEIAAFPLTYTSAYKYDGTADNFIITTGHCNITKEQLENTHTKYVICKNNPYMSSEYYIIRWYSQILAETDISQAELIKWCKVHPIAKATTGIESAQLEKILDDLYNNNKHCAVISDNSKLVTGSPSTVSDTVINLTNVNDVQNMHFLSEFHYDVLRRFCSLYNIPFHSNSKSAQSLESELHNMDIFSTILPRERKKEREKNVKLINNTFGWNVEFDYSEWVKAENKVIELASAENPNETETTETEEQNNEENDNK